MDCRVTHESGNLQMLAPPDFPTIASIRLCNLRGRAQVWRKSTAHCLRNSLTARQTAFCRKAAIYI
jgi:hypothetical protein